MFQSRYLEPYILADMNKKMVFIGGPRQVGKTTLALHIGEQIYQNRTYLNWDNSEHRRRMMKQEFPKETGLIIFDEIHKYRLWKNYVKGIYDTYQDSLRILVTGSARLDLYRRGGDSLFGRYRYYRLHPFSVRELLGEKWTGEPFVELPFLPQAPGEFLMHRLLEFGGFPEPLFAEDHQTLRRFHTERTERLIKEDIRDVERVHDLSLLQLLADMVPEKVASLLSIHSIAEDLSASHKTIAHWVDILERFYYHYRIYPYTSKKIRSLKKQPKLYLWDWSEIQDPAVRLENMVASHLLKTVHLLYDFFGYKADLFFLRDTAGREVDFLVAVNGKPWFSVEVKSRDTQVSPHLFYFGKKLHIPFQYQVVAEGLEHDMVYKGVNIMRLDHFLSGLA
ncbi:MAG: ATP-binding protein [Candidatus Magasanikbacteria bacterium]|nr:ATP-binding protein [Candidatus Magasanikbacteria bacterium]